MPPSRYCSFPVLFIAALLVTGGECASQSIVLRQDTLVLHIPGPGYAAGTLHRLLFGNTWRDAWTTPVRVPMLDLRRSAGGLTPVKRGGGFQTASLRFMGADGFQYKFRSIDKDPVSVLPVELRETFVASVVQDMIATANPMAPLATAPLLNAVGILQAEPTLVIMPDDPTLGVFRAEFGGRAGMIELHPDEHESDDTAFGGAQKIIGTVSLFEKLDHDNDDRVHAASYLKARIMDLFMGDWDRHTGQWRWARFDEDGTKYWHPIPRDRDQAFCRYDGLVPWLSTVAIPQIENCGQHYPGIQYLSWSGRHLDRRFLAGSDWKLYDSLLSVIIPALSDSVLRQAASALPVEWYARDAESFLSLLHARRDGLPDAVREYYRVLSAEVDVRLSAKDDLVLIQRDAPDIVELSVFKRKHPDIRILHRRFTGDATREIRVYCGAGDDSIVVRGRVPSSINLIVLGEKGRDSFVDSSLVAEGGAPLLALFPGTGAGTTFIDEGKGSSFITGPSTNTGRRSPELDTLDFYFEHKQRDWGAMCFPILYGMWNNDLGGLIGGGASYTRYGFARTPHAAKISMYAGIAPMTANFDAHIEMDFPLPHNAAVVRVDALFTTFEVLNYFGMGNVSVISDNDLYSYTVKQNELRIRPSISFQPLSRLTVNLGASIRYVGHDHDDELQYLLMEKPYGYDRMLFMEGGASVTYDSRDHQVWPRTGLLMKADLTRVPAVYDALNAWTSVASDVRLYLTPDALFGATLAVRAGGRHIEGRAPFFASSFLGGIENLRGFEKNRFAGTSAFFTAAELRLGVADIFILLPARLGLLAFVESGRVWQPGEFSTRWHASFGGGIWLAPVSDDFTVSASVAASNENLRFDLLGGFAF